MKQHISTVVRQHIEPIMDSYRGRVWTQEFARAVQRHLYEVTGKLIGFRQVRSIAVNHAYDDIQNARTFSFNIIPSSTLREELNTSPAYRRARFDNLYNPRPFLEDPQMAQARFGISIPKVNSRKQYDVQVIIDGNGCVDPVAVIGFYGTSMNTWGKRVGLKQTTNAHGYPSTHYMDSSAAPEYVFFFRNSQYFKGDI